MFGAALTPIDKVDEVWSNIYRTINSGTGMTFNYDTLQTTGYSGADDEDPGRRIDTGFIEKTSEPGIIQAVTKFVRIVAGLSNFGVPAKSQRESTIISRKQTDSDTTSSELVTFTVQDTTNTLQLNSAPSGNLFMSNLESSEDISSLISNYELVGDRASGIIIGDSNSALLHYRPSTVEATGVSHLRLATWDKLPHTRPFDQSRPLHS